MLYKASILLALFAHSVVSRQAGPNRVGGKQHPQKRITYTPSTIADLIPLGSASNYSVFTLTGISTAPGTVAAGQVVNGDIGVAPIALTAITGFGAVQEGKSNTPFVTGNIHGPPYSTNTPSDIVNAYNIAAGKTPSGAIVTGAGTLDSGVAMTPGVYRWTGALALGVGKTLTLNGQCGDIFIFQTAGAITTGANSQIVLTGGLTAATVYWVSATSVTTGVSSAFAGIILAKTNVVIAGILVGAVYAQTETALHAATISAPVATFATTQIGLVCNKATCAVNYGLAAGVCVQCQAGYSSNGGSSTCQPCTGVNFINSLGSCVACSTGTLSCDVNTGFALSCSPGYFGSSTTACAGCTPGFASPGGIVTATNNACTGCLAGFYASSKLSINCIACTGTVGTDYATCASDTGNDVTCPAGLALGSTSRFASNTTCSACLNGYFSRDSAVSCTKCLIGTSSCSPTTGYGTACLAGYSSTSTSACSACLGGTYSTAIGTVCSQVPAGSFALGPAATSYSSCAPAGKSAVGASSCTLCASGYASSDGGLTCARICVDDTHYLDSNSACQTCSTGTVKCDSFGNAISCLPGYFGTSTSPCKGCTVGFASPGGLVSSTNNACTGCLAGFYASSTLSATCIACTGKSGTDYATCAPDTGNDITCPAGLALGRLTQSGFNTVCGACIPGLFSVDLSTVCTPCTSGTKACSAATGFGTACNDGYGSNGATTACFACLSGSVSSNGATSCTLCLGNTYAAASASMCSVSDSNAAVVDHTTGTSITCNAGYGIVNGFCAKCPARTYNAGIASSCLLCSDKLSLSCNAATGESLTCASNAHRDLSSGICVCNDPYTLSKDGSSCIILLYKILIRDALDQQFKGFVSQIENSFGVFSTAFDEAYGLTIIFPPLGSSTPVALTATSSYGSGPSLAIGLGKSGSTFDSTTSAYVWITQSQRDINNEYFASQSDYRAGLAEPNVWVLGAQDSQGRYPISLSFIGDNQSVVNCAHFYMDTSFALTSYSGYPLGATCGSGSSTDVTVLLFLVLE